MERNLGRNSATGIARNSLIGFPVVDAAEPWGGLAYAEEYIREWKDHPLITPALAPHAPYTVPKEWLLKTKALAERIWLTSEVFYADPFGDMHNRMKEALVLLGRQARAVVRPPLVKLSATEIARIAEALDAAGLRSEGAAGLQAPRAAAE